LRQRGAFIGIDIGLHGPGREACGRNRTRRADRLAFDCAFHDPAATLFGDRDFALALDIAQAGFGIDRDQLAVDLAGELRRVGVERFSDAHRAALQQGNPCGGSGKLRDGQFERHSRIPCLPVARPADSPHLPQFQRSFDVRTPRGAIRLTMPKPAEAPDSARNRGISGALSRSGTENRGCG
jgi:hypothetical protein